MMPVHRDSELAHIAERFFGYGRWDAPFRFIGRPEAERRNSPQPRTPLPGMDGIEMRSGIHLAFRLHEKFFRCLRSFHKGGKSHR